MFQSPNREIPFCNVSQQESESKMKVKVQLRVLSIEDAAEAAKFLQEQGVSVEYNAQQHEQAQQVVKVSPKQWEEMDEYQETPHLPRFMYPEREDVPGVFYDEAVV
jgi:hypothetical protein